MPNIKLKPSKLHKLQKDNKIKDAIKIIRNNCEIDHVNFGKYVATFNSLSTDNIVYKLVPMNINYFKEKKDKDPYDLYRDSKRMKYFFLVIKDILYCDKNVFLYTQEKIKIVRKITIFVVINVILIIYKMIKENLVCCDIDIHNLGEKNHDILLFDLQGLRSYEYCDKDKLYRNIKMYLDSIKYTDYKNKYKNKEDLLLGLKEIFLDIYKINKKYLTLNEISSIDFKINLVF